MRSSCTLRAGACPVAAPTIVREVRPASLMEIALAAALGEPLMDGYGSTASTATRFRCASAS